MTTCPLCCHEADAECFRCGARIDRNSRGEADRARIRSHHDARRWVTVYQRRQNAAPDDGGPRSAPFLHRPNSQRDVDVDDLDALTIVHRGRLRFGRGAA